MKCWARQGFIPSFRSCHQADEHFCRSFCRSSLRSCCSYSKLRATLRSSSEQDRTHQGSVLCSKSAFKRANFQPTDNLQGRASTHILAAGVASQPPLPPLPIERGDSTLTRTLSGLILGAFGSLCIYSGGLLFTGRNSCITSIDLQSSAEPAISIP